MLRHIFIYIVTQITYNSMITDRNLGNRGPDFKILMCTDKQITVQASECGKLIYREYTSIPKQNQLKIIRWNQICAGHPNLLSLPRIQCVNGEGNSQNNSTFGLYIQYYAGSLQKQLGIHAFEYDVDQILNTFQPILEAIQYLRSHNFNISAIGLKNIVITQNQQVKLIDNSILEPLNASNSKVNLSILQIYEQLSLMIYKLLVPNPKQKQKQKERTQKSWKSRIQILKKKLNKQNLSMFMSILDRSQVNYNEPSKNKKIGKDKNKNRRNVLLEGKQNKLLQ